jgi:hypothetical protein
MTTINNIQPFFDIIRENKVSFDLPLHTPVRDINTFVKNLNQRFQFSLLKLDEFKWDSSYLLAGGAPLNAIQAQVDTQLTCNSDLDLFILGNDDKMQKAAALRLCEYLAKDRAQEIYFAQKGSIIYVWIKGLLRPIQLIILPDCRTPADVLCNFDQSCCGFGYDGQEVWCTDETVEALRSGTNVSNMEKYHRLAHYNPDKSNLTFVRRCRKMEAKGFQTVFFSEIDFRDYTLFPDVPIQEMIFPIFEAGKFQENCKRLQEEYGCSHVTTIPKNIRFKEFITNEGSSLYSKYYKHCGISDQGPFRKQFPTSQPIEQPPTTTVVTEAVVDSSWSSWMLSPVYSLMETLKLK